MRLFLQMISMVVTLCLVSCKEQYEIYNAYATISPAPTSHEVADVLTKAYPGYVISKHTPHYPYDYTSIALDDPLASGNYDIDCAVSVQESNNGEHYVYFSSVWRSASAKSGVRKTLNGSSRRRYTKNLANQVFGTIGRRWQLSEVVHKHHQFYH